MSDNKLKNADQQKQNKICGATESKRYRKIIKTIPTKSRSERLPHKSSNEIGDEDDERKRMKRKHQELPPIQSLSWKQCEHGIGLPNNGPWGLQPILR
ncbi:MAG: hypothetical protein WCS42_24905 [Verrucomicrobiota bacterium]